MEPIVLTGYLQNIFNRHYRGTLPVRSAPSLDAPVLGVVAPWIVVRAEVGGSRGVGGCVVGRVERGDRAGWAVCILSPPSRGGGGVSTDVSGSPSPCAQDDGRCRGDGAEWERGGGSYRRSSRLCCERCSPKRPARRRR